MPLSWNQIRVKASDFSKEWKDASYEKGEAQSFYNALFEVFGMRRRAVARFEEHVRKLDNRSGFIDLFWPGVLIAEHKSSGGDLGAAADQAGDYFDALPEIEKPRYQLVCDFQNFQLLDREQDESIAFSLSELDKNIEHFAFILGRQKPLSQSREPVSIDAAKIVASLYDSLESSGYTGDHLERFLVRTVFCFFADNAGIFEPRGLFLDFLYSRTQEDGSDLGAQLTALYQVLNTPYEKRQTILDDDLAQFAYINGKLFDGPLTIPSFSKDMRQAFLNAANFDWSSISPAIFGSLFQSVLNKQERRQFGAYYTSELDILKVVNDLFLSELYDEFNSICQGRSNKEQHLRDFREALRSLTWFDPACGCGNFLSVAYREIRKLELEVLKELKMIGVFDLQNEEISVIDVHQFFGIEIREYSARIAETALWMTDHIANNEVSFELGMVFSRVPLNRSPSIVIDDALEIDWGALAGEKKAFSYILSNPPYKGSKKQTVSQRQQISAIAAGSTKSTTLDYVAGWIFKGAAMVQHGAKLAYVTTNSVVQGEQAAQIWPTILGTGQVEIYFAHQSFKWRTESVKSAAVHVVVMGLRPSEQEGLKKNLYRYTAYDDLTTVSLVSAISPYLISADNLRNANTVVHSALAPVNGMPKTTIGSKPVDGGYFILSEEERTELLAKEPEAEEFVRPYVGATEWLTGSLRYILYLEDIPPAQLRRLTNIKAIVQKVRLWRECRIPNKVGNKTRQNSDALADTPTKYHVTRVPNSSFLIIPEVTSERRKYVPIGWLEPPTIPSNLLKIVLNASLSDFALLTSSMHMAWLAHIGGRLESRYRYSTQVVYNTFPLPSQPSKGKKSCVESLAQSVLDARGLFAGTTLEDLYDPDTMPPKLLKAHKSLDTAVDRLYRASPFDSNEERAEFLLGLYEQRSQA